MKTDKEEQIQSLVTILKRFHKSKGNITKKYIKKPIDPINKSQIKKTYQPINSVRLYEQSARNNKIEASGQLQKITYFVKCAHEDNIIHKNSVFLFDSINNTSKIINLPNALTQKQIAMGEHARRYGIFYRQKGFKNNKNKQIQNDIFIHAYKSRIKSEIADSVFCKKRASPKSSSAVKSSKKYPYYIENQHYYDYSGKYTRINKNKNALAPILVADFGLDKSTSPGLNRYSPLSSQVRMNNYQKYCQNIFEKYRDKSRQNLQKSYKIHTQEENSQQQRKNHKSFYTQSHQNTIQKNKRKIKINQNRLSRLKHVNSTKKKQKYQQKNMNNVSQMIIESFHTSELKPMHSNKEQSGIKSIKTSIKRYQKTTPKLYTQQGVESITKSKKQPDGHKIKSLFIQTNMKLQGWQPNKRNIKAYGGKIPSEVSRANSTGLNYNICTQLVKTAIIS